MLAPSPLVAIHLIAPAWAQGEVEVILRCFRRGRHHLKLARSNTGQKVSITRITPYKDQFRAR